jgi:hypothetical protein
MATTNAKMVISSMIYAGRSVSKSSVYLDAKGKVATKCTAKNRLFSLNALKIGRTVPLGSAYRDAHAE